MICARCNRVLLRPPVMLGGMAFGPKCKAAVVGSKPRRVRLFTARTPKVDSRQGDLFAQEARP